MSASPVAYLAMCSCGWHGIHDYPPAQEGHWAATSDWVQHIRPFLAVVPPEWLLNRSDGLRDSLTELAETWPLQALGVLTAIERWHKPLVDQAVVTARAAGTSWADIGAVLGITKQSAHQRFKGVTRRQPE